MKIFDYKTANPIVQVSDTPVPSTLYAIINRSEQFVIGCTDNSRVTVWSIENNWQRVVSLIEHARGVNYTALSLDDRTQVSSKATKEKSIARR